MTQLHGGDVMNKMLNEKENYIATLENEISEMRKEIEIQRDQLVQADINTIGNDTNINQSIYMSLGRNSAFNAYGGGGQGNGVGPSSPSYLRNGGLTSSLAGQSRDAIRSQHVAPLRSNSRERKGAAH